MKILQATHDFLPRHRAGAEIYALGVGQQLQRAGHEVHVVCAEFDPAQPHGALRERSHGGLAVTELINNHAADSFAQTYCSPLLAGRLARLLDRVTPDVVHLHSLLTLSLDLPLLARMRGIPCVATLHDYSLFCAANGTRSSEGGGRSAERGVRSAECGAVVCDEPVPHRCAACFACSALGALTAAGKTTGGWAGPWLGRAAAQVRRFAPDVAGRLLGSLPPVSVSAADVQRRLDFVRRHVVPAVDLFIAPSETMAEFHARMGVPEDKLIVSDYGMPALEVQRRERRPGEALRLGFVGSLVPHKGAHLLLEALARLPADLARLQIFGDTNTDPAYAARLARQAAGLPARLEGPFEPTEAAQVYGQLDALVVPSLWPENSPLVVHEAFQAGLPVVGFATGGVAELVTHEASGLLCEPSSVEQLASALERLASEPGLRRRLASGVPAVKSMEQDADQQVARYRGLIADRNQIAKNAPARRPELRTPRSALRAPEVSIMLVTKDGAATLPRVLDAIGEQRVDFGYEVVAVDSGSSDGTVELLRQRADRVVQIPPQSFDHGLTRNLGLSCCRGQLLVLLVQDAIPADHRWLEALTAPLRQAGSEGIAGSWARQLPSPDADALTRFYLKHWIASSDQPRVAALDGPDDLWRRSPWERYLLCSFDNVCSCIRRDVWRTHPLRRAAIAEDLSWAREVLLAGHQLVYTPAAAVIHSHQRPARHELRRTYLAHQRLRTLFGLRTVPTPLHLAGAIAATLASHAATLARQPGPRRSGQARRALTLSLALPLGQYLGALSADAGLPLLATEGVV